MNDIDWQRPPSGYSELLGYRFTKRDTGYCEVELMVEHKHLNRLDVPHGGALATLIDTAAGAAVGFAHGPDTLLPADQARKSDALFDVGHASERMRLAVGAQRRLD